jgi:ubiquinone/menaquinone biosynthesis C-methylase UbiE
MNTSYSIFEKKGKNNMTSKGAVTPNRILDMGWNFARSRALATGVELNVFTHIADGKNTAGEIAVAADSNLKGMEMLLNALVGLKLLRKRPKGEYFLAPDSQQFLVRGKPSFLGDMSMDSIQSNQGWLNLTASVKTGKPYMRVDEIKTAEDFFPPLVKALFNLNYQAARYAASFLRKKGKKITNILDVASGSCVWGIGHAQEFEDAKLTAVDFPSLGKVAHEYARNFKLHDRFEFIEGDIRSVDFGDNRYDLIILGHICHSEGRVYTQKLLKKSYNALKAGGALLIAEFMPNDGKTGPAIPLLFGLNMLVNTNEGEVFTAKEFKHWLTACAFKKVEILNKAPTVSPLILATK